MSEKSIFLHYLGFYAPCRPLLCLPLHDIIQIVSLSGLLWAKTGEGRVWLVQWERYFGSVCNTQIPVSILVYADVPRPLLNCCHVKKYIMWNSPTAQKYC